MIHWSDKLQLAIDDQTLTTSEVSALTTLLKERRIDPLLALEHAGIEPATLCDPASRISLKQQYLVQKCAAVVYGDSSLPLRLAQRLHLTSYGIAGYALLSSASLSDAIRVAELYSPLLNLKFSLALEVAGDQARLCFVDRYSMDPTMRRSCVVLELAKIAVLLREVFGEGFKPNAAYCSCADDLQSAELARILGTAVKRSADRTEIHFDASLLACILPQSHAATHTACVEICDRLMEGFASRYDLVRHVKDIILKSSGRVPMLREVADLLCVSQRTLRRKLEALSTSYNQILEEIRKELAIGYLTTTQFTTESIADLLGYSEAANFRHAFKRWTGTSPRYFRASRREVTAKPTQHFPRANGMAATHNHRAILDGAVAAWG